MNEPRTEMKCRICGGFSSAQTCHACDSSPAYLAYSVAVMERQKTEGRCADLEDENAGLRAYAVALHEALREAAEFIDDLPTMNSRYDAMVDRYRALLAKNPNPAGLIPATEASGSFTTEASGAGRAGTVYAHETRKKPDYSRAYWGQPGDPYPWIVREPSGQCWGPFDTNEAAGKWADDNKIDTCDFEDVMPPPELRHQSCTKVEDAVRRVDAAFGRAVSSVLLDEINAAIGAINAGHYERAAEILRETRPLCVHQVCNDDTARMDFLSRGSAFTDHREEDLLRSDTPLGKAVLFSYDGVRYFAKGETLREAVDAAMKRDAELRHVAGKKEEGTYKGHRFDCELLVEGGGMRCTCGHAINHHTEKP